jgi:hypothetical protein
MEEEYRRGIWERNLREESGWEGNWGEEYGGGSWERNVGEERGTSERNMGDEYRTGTWWRNLKEEHIYCRINHGGEILEKKPYGEGIMEDKTWRRNH